MLVSGLWVHDVTSFGIALVAHGVSSGCVFTAWASIPQRLLPREKFAEIGSVGGIIGSVIGIFFGPSVGQMLDWSHDNYRLTFLASSALTVAALWAFVILHRKFMALGGPKNYAAPE
jgi:MFS family permease